MSVLLCRTLYLTSLAFNTTTQIALELATPPQHSSEDDDGLALCFMGANYDLRSSIALVNATTSDGDQFTIDDSPAPVSVDLIEYTSLWNILQNDTFYQDSESLRHAPDTTNL